MNLCCDPAPPELPLMLNGLRALQLGHRTLLPIVQGGMEAGLCDDQRGATAAAFVGAGHCGGHTALPGPPFNDRNTCNRCGGSHCGGLTESNVGSCYPHKQLD